MDQHVRIILGHVFNNEQLHLLSRIGARRPRSWSVRCVSQPERDDVSLPTRGIALQTSYAALLVLRMLQSAGASGRFLQPCS